MSRKELYKSRHWLNSNKREPAFIIVAISEHEWDSSYSFVLEEERPSKRVLWASVTISDCSRQIELDFDCNTTEQTKDRLAKVDRMIAELEMVRYHLENYIDEHEGE